MWMGHTGELRQGKVQWRGYEHCPCLLRHTIVGQSQWLGNNTSGYWPSPRVRKVHTDCAAVLLLLQTDGGPGAGGNAQGGWFMLDEATIVLAMCFIPECPVSATLGAIAMRKGVVGALMDIASPGRCDIHLVHAEEDALCNQPNRPKCDFLRLRHTLVRKQS